MFKAGFGEYDSTVPARAWDVTADGQRFLLLKNMSTGDEAVRVMHVVLNWAEELRRLVPTK